jgi:hypothetical protein
LGAEKPGNNATIASSRINRPIRIARIRPMMEKTIFVSIV